MDDRRIADYFVVAGLPDKLQPVDDFSKDGTYLKQCHNKAPITDITVIFPGFEESVPPEYEVIEQTPTGLLADLNHGSLRSPEVFLCFRRGRDKPPLVDIGVMYEGKERILPDSEVVELTPGGRPANVNNSAARTLLTYRRAHPSQPCNGLVVTDICVIVASKQETPPHAFCMINKNLNKGMVGSDVFLCYKKSMNRVNHITYKPDILVRYPLEDRSNFPFPISVPLFCLPVGASLECWPRVAQQPAAVFSTFVLTVSDAAEKVYGSAVTFYERYPTERVTEEQKAELDPGGVGGDDVTYHVNKCICLLSHWPFFDTFEKFLLFLYKMSLNSLQPVPIERYISHVLDDVPFPSPHRPRILLQLSAETRLILTQPEDLPLPRSGASFRQLLLNLGADNCLLLLLCALTEQKLLVHSLRPDVLTAVAEAISMIIFPFKWQCPYIPLCPLGLAEVLHAPLPFLIGVDSRFFDLYDPPTDVNCVDLDTNNITVCDEKRQLTIKLLPKKATRVLRNSLERIYHKLALFMEKQAISDRTVDTTTIDQDFQLKRREQMLELEIQEAFLRFMATILKGYRSYLLPIIKAPTIGTTDTNSLFDLQGFLRSRDRAYHKFFTMTMRTQMFIRFIEERSFVSDMDAGLAFFDECTEKVENDEVDSRLLELDESHQSERTIYIEPPEPSNNKHYVYERFELKEALFASTKRGGDKEAKTNLLVRAVLGPDEGGGGPPGSPMARRTKHEIKSAQKIARKYATSPELWAKCLLTTCYSIWFIHLPSCVLFAPSKSSVTLQLAYDVIVRMHKAGLTPADEVCYRVMMQLCGAYSQPGLAVKLLFQMKRVGVQPNAITYGFYNRAVLEATWPSNMSQSSVLWNKLRNVVLGAARFRQAGCKMANRRRRLSTATEDGDGASICSATSLTATANASNAPGVSQPVTSADEVDLMEVTIQVPELQNQSKTLELSVDVGNPESHDCRSHSLANIANSMDFSVQKFDRFRSRVGSIVRPSGLPLLSPGAAVKQQTFDSSAGLLMTGGGGGGGGAGGGLEEGAVTIPQRNRSGSCTELMSGGCSRSGIPPSGAAQPVHPPASPKPTVTSSRQDDCFRQLSRSESFANDAGILAKLKQQPPEGESGACATKAASKSRAAKSLFASGGGSNLLNLQIVSENLPLDDDGEQQQNGGSQNQDGGAKKASCESLTCRSPIKSPARTTPVTENDPLGALLTDDPEQQTAAETRGQQKCSRRFSDRGRDARVASASNIEYDQSTGAPHLFDRRNWAHKLRKNTRVVRSATFHQAGDDEEEESEEEEEEYGEYDDDGDVEDESPCNEVGVRAPLHRSSTMPIEGGDGGVGMTSSSRAATLGSTFKLPFSPSSLTSKKSNELIKGGINSLKTAATSMAKKFDDLISANSTPIKSASARGSALGLDQDGGLDEDESGEESVSAPRRKISSEFSPYAAKQHIDAWSSNLKELFSDSRKGSASNLQPLGETSAWSSQQCLLLPDNLYPKTVSARHSNSPVALELRMSTAQKCHHCQHVLYDEQIMAGWLPEDSNLNTKCQLCHKATVPFLTVQVTDHRHNPKSNSEDKRTKDEEKTGEGKEEEAEEKELTVGYNEPVLINVPYLNPLVLRKELESILYTEGDSCLTQSKFVDEHPIIYWNMVWVFERVCVCSHLPGLCLQAACICTPPGVSLKGTQHHPSWAEADHTNVLVRCLWDNPRLHEEVGQPMYILWNQDDQQSSLVSALVTDRTTVSRSVMELVIDLVRCNNMEEPMRRLASERHKLKGRHSLYRDILFLTFTVVGQDNIDLSAFDREYTAAYERLQQQHESVDECGASEPSASNAAAQATAHLFLRSDQPLSPAELYCRSYFRPLQL
ncbi:DENN domain-containing protein Crag isoform X2 [Nilaparvata lugens]|uniref:DENN domain-containing protein Crag isoform X2 n=1 Tax=Nilaparvata lugens TaxID=108931 RepID=UPI00193D4F0C|nr:DENN domain-containing protein Crag isoform X2 [Nilaparvata lugens]